MACTKTSGAKEKTLGFTIYLNRRRLHVGVPWTRRMLFGMTYSIPESDMFSAKITYFSQDNLQLKVT